jgi:CDP-diacylglycerol--glycerol-3-phosphate 3-phosphatidyltransferase
MFPMTVPDALTSSRLIAAPLYLLAFVGGARVAGVTEASALVLGILFVVIEGSDLLDGYLARKTGNGTELGKLLDPLADSVSRLTYFLCFTVVGIMPLWVFALVLYRDLGVAFARVLAQRDGRVMGARLTGKIKAWVYGIAGFLGTAHLVAQRLLHLDPQSAIIVTTGLQVVYIGCALIAVGSLIDYLLPTISGMKSGREG